MFATPVRRSSRLSLALVGALSLFMLAATRLAADQCGAAGTCGQGNCTLNCTGCSPACGEYNGSDSTGEYRYCRCQSQAESECCHLIYRKKSGKFRKPDAKGDCDEECALSGTCKVTGDGSATDPHQAGCIEATTP